MTREAAPLRPPSAPGRTARTIAHLSPAQLWHRLRLTLRRRLWELGSERVESRYRRRAAALPAARFGHPGLARVARLRERLRPGHDARRVAEAALAGRFEFLGRSLDLGRDVAWHRPDLDSGTRLWKTLLHEFSFAEDLARTWRETGDPACRRHLFALLEGWRRASPIGRPGFALDAWNARAVANRLIHFAVAGSLLALEGGEAERLGREVGLHGLFLRDNLERDLRGNHLLRDAVGLVFAQEVCGGVPDALALLEEEVALQVLDDGCHVERSPMYHALALRDLLEAKTLLGGGAPAWLEDAGRRMAGFLEAILLGDGDLPLLGDAWRGEVECPALLAAARDELGEPAPPAAGGASGIAVLRAGAARLVWRAGPHGPDYQLGHAHADLLSFDLSLGTRRLVTDTGTSLYDAGPERQHLRSTAAHNTLAIDGQEQIEAWGSFRTGRRGRARLRGRGESCGWHFAWASHDAYAWLPGRPLHRRLLALSERAALVLDAVTGSGRHRIDSRLHLHPDRDRGLEVLALGSAARLGEAPLHERFGETRPMTELRVEVEAPLPWIGGWWIPLRPGGRVESDLRLQGSVLELRCGGDAGLHLRWELRDEAPKPAVSLELWSGSRPSAT